MRGHALDGTSDVGRVSGVSKIADNIRLALLTPKGTRPNLPKFGSRLHLLQFELICPYTIDLLHFCIQEAVRDSLDDILLLGIDYDVFHDLRAFSVNISFCDRSSGLSGRARLAFAKGEFS